MINQQVPVSMSAQDALHILGQVSRLKKLELSLDDHQAIQLALKTLADAIKPADVVEDKKPLEVVKE